MSLTTFLAVVLAVCAFGFFAVARWAFWVSRNTYYEHRRVLGRLCIVAGVGCLAAALTAAGFGWAGA